MTNPFTSCLRCNTCLDSSKTGLKILDDVFKADEAPFQNQRVKSMVSDDLNDSPSNMVLLTASRRPSHLGPFVLDILVELGQQIAEEHLRNFDQLLKQVVFKYRDNDLLGPKAAAEAAAQKAATDGYRRLIEDLETVEKHVDDAHLLWVAAVSKSKSPHKKKQKTDGSSEDLWRKAAQVYAEGPSCSQGALFIANLEAVKASFAYDRNLKFAISVAHKDLCAIKARATGKELPMTREFGETMSIGASFVRALGFDEGEYI